MKMYRMLTSLGVGLTSLLVLPTIVCAQDAPPGNNIGIGYSYLRLFDEESIPTGWNVSLAGGGKKYVSGVADFGGHYLRSGGETWALHTFQGGVRVGAPRTARVIPFAQALFGGGLATESRSDFVWVFQPGAGVDIPIRPGGVALRTQVDIPVYFADGERATGLRWGVGVVIPLK